ncbi:hypothetical protein DsansV1_C25g0187551 [Dioscorea sansibarensis]
MHLLSHLGGLDPIKDLSICNKNQEPGLWDSACSTRTTTCQPKPSFFSLPFSRFESKLSNRIYMHMNICMHVLWC